MDRQCESCEQTFVAKTSRARFCSTTCRSRARRAAQAAEQSVAADERAGIAEHELVTAVRKELVEVNALGTVAGQLALQVARRIADPDAAGISTMSKELRALLAEATGARPPVGDEPPAPVEEVEDEVTKARRQREEARQAAGLA